MKPSNYIFVATTTLLTLSGNYAKSNIKPEKNKIQRPNIIFLLTDDQRWDALGAAGNDIIYTPNMDQLASDGVYFSKAFVTSPISAASRASILTGFYERTHGFTFGTPKLAKEYVNISYPQLLKENGYYTGFIGKFGVWVENQADTSLFDVYDPYGTGFYWELTGEAYGTHIHLTNFTGQKAVNFIKQAPEDKSFCLSVSYNAPHAEDKSLDQYIWPPDFDTLYQNITIPPPDLGDEKYFEAQPAFVREGLNRIRWHWRFDTPEKYQRMVKGYYRMISGVDRTIGRIRRALIEKGVADNTIIILMGDNGYFLGERGFAGKWLMYDNSLRVPLIIYDPRTDNHLQNDEIVLNVDIAPTILDYARIDIPGQMQGKSLKPLVDGKNISWRTEMFCEHLFDHNYIPQSEGVRTIKWKYFRYRHHPGNEELYDLENDPLEKNNLAGNVFYKKTLQEMRVKCNNWIKKLKKQQLK